MALIYFDNCVTSQPAPEVIEAMLPYMREKFWFPANYVRHGSVIAADIDNWRRTVADSLGARPGEIHFTRGGTSANNLAIKGFVTANAANGSHIICSVVDYPDILTNAAFFEQSGFEVSYISCDRDGRVNLDELRDSLREDTILVMTTLANHTVGTIQDVRAMRGILDAAGSQAKLLVDAGQAYARMPIDVNDPAIDMLTVSAHKIHGPQGVGALYVRKGVHLAQMMHGINRVDSLETGGVSIAGMAGFARAVELAFDDLPGAIAHIRALSDYLLDRIESAIPHTMLNGPRGEERISHNINVSFDYIEGEAMMMMLSLQDIVVATGSACASQGLKTNYVMIAMGRTHEQSHGSMKFTLSRYNTREEIDLTVEKLAGIVAELRRRSPLYNPENE
ncbi:MAG: cysteine desulfurase [Candidatus Cloacimonetes bacterium]|nr:cysteine desulfurase [Candidatus Cloacimonadota bacterium]